MLFQYPSVYENSVVFVGNDTLWSAPLVGGKATRISSTFPSMAWATHSPDGAHVAFTSGTSVYIQNVDAGGARCLTTLSGPVRIVCWKDAEHLWIASSFQSSFREMFLYSIHWQSGQIKSFPIGPCAFISAPTSALLKDRDAEKWPLLGPCVIQREGYGYGTWRHYKGGLRGKLWIDTEGQGAFKRFLPNISYNVVDPLWVRSSCNMPERIYFCSDLEEGGRNASGNIYSVTPQGHDLRRHTHHTDFYVSNMRLCGQSALTSPKAVYQCGAGLYTLDLNNAHFQGASRPISVTVRKTLCLGGVGTSDSASGDFSGDQSRKNSETYSVSGGRVESSLNESSEFAAPLSSGGDNAFSGEDQGGCHAHYYVFRDMCERDSQVSGEKIAIEAPKEPLVSGPKGQNPTSFLTGFAPCNEGERVALITRGSLFYLSVKPGLNIRLGGEKSGRYRVSLWLATKQLAALLHTGLEEHWVLFSKKDEDFLPKSAEFSGDQGRVTSAVAHPILPCIACTNHRHQLFILNFETGEVTHVDQSAYGPIHGCSWSPCGRWLAYDCAPDLQGTVLKIFDTTERCVRTILEDRFRNISPAFDLLGRYLYFISARHFKSRPDPLGLSMIYEEPGEIFALVLQKTQDPPHFLPFLPQDEKKKDPSTCGHVPSNGGEASHVGEGIPLTHKEPHSAQEHVSDSKDTILGKSGDIASQSAASEKQSESPPTVIDFDELHQRLCAVGASPRDYQKIWPLKDNRLMYVAEGGGGLDLYSYSHNSQKEERLVQDIDDIEVSANHGWMVVVKKGEVQHVAAGAKGEAPGDTPFEQNGRIDMGRINLIVSPEKELRHMYDEAWSLQKLFFWKKDMGGVDWDAVYKKYLPLAEKASCQGELKAILWDMHGELRTSHAYVEATDPGSISGALRNGALGADLTYDAHAKGYVVQRLIQGNPGTHHPLRRSGMRITNPGDVIYAIDGYEATSYLHPNDMLRGKAGKGVTIHIGAPGEHRQVAMVLPVSMGQETQWRYQEWVESNRRHVYAVSKNEAGYIHIPDMQAFGHEEFICSFLRDFNKNVLIIDARFNGGGNLSPLVLDWLNRQRSGYDQSRHHGTLPYPNLSPKGPMVLLVNGHTGSDGDIFTHQFRRMQRGTIIGCDTWGGIVGIWPRHGRLLDHSLRTTQPEFAFFFYDQKEPIEGFGVKPDVYKERTPQEYAHGKDSQLDMAISVGLRALHSTEEDIFSTL